MDQLAALRSLHLLQKLPESALTGLLAYTQVIDLQKDECLFHSNEPSRGFYGVASGRVLLSFPEGSHGENHTNKTLSVINTGEMFCDAIAFLGSTHPVNAVAAGNASIVVIEQKGLLDLITHNADFALKMFGHLSRALEHMVHEVRDLKLSSSNKRLACFLLHYAPQVESSTFEFTLPVQKQVVAARLNMSPAHFSRALQNLAKEKIIAVHGRRISVLDSERLRNAAT